MVLFSNSFKRIVLLFFLVMGFVFNLSAQVDTEKKPLTKREINKNLRKARRNSDNGKYEAAERKYLKLIKTDPNNYDYNAELGLNYFNSPYKKVLAIPYLEKALKKAEADFKSEFYYPLGICYRMTGRYDEAIENLTSFLKVIEKHGTYLRKSEEQELIAEVKREIEMCNNAKNYNSDDDYRFTADETPQQAVLTNFSPSINSFADDYSPVFLHQDTVIFTSRREGSTGNRINWDGKYYEDIYISYRSGDNWSAPVSIGPNINTKAHDASNSISSNSKQLYIYRADKNGSIYVSTRLGIDKWSKPLKLSSNINSKAWETSLGISLSDTVIYFSSDRKGGYGGRDIYKSIRLTDKLWSTPENLGADVNTPFEDDAPFISADGKTLYFSSTGHNSIGGFDVFASTLKNGKWTKAQNLGSPINSSSHDIYFLPSPDGKSAYVSSSRVKDSLNDMNIYKVNFECQTLALATLKGAVVDASTAAPLPGTVSAKEESSDKTITADISATGEYELKLEPAKNYVITITSGNITASDTISLSKQCEEFDQFQLVEIKKEASTADVTFKNAFFDLNKKTGGSQELAKKVEFLNTIDPATTKLNYSVVKRTVEVGGVAKKPVKQVLSDTEFNNVYFGKDKFDLDPTNKTFLNDLVKYLKTNKTHKVEISGHASAEGSEEYNLQLSRNRANAIAEYLKKNGIPNDRIIIKGLGVSKPLESNETEEGKQANRRAEFKIIK